MKSQFCHFLVASQPALTEVSRALRARNAERVSKMSPGAPEDIFETLSAFRARRARETSVRGGLVRNFFRAKAEELAESPQVKSVLGFARHLLGICSACGSAFGVEKSEGLLLFGRDSLKNYFLGEIP